jgi:hypothetical protein
MRIYGFKFETGYYLNELIELGYCDLKEEYKSYHKILVIRNPYERFISGFLEELLNHDFYKTMDITFYNYCHFLKDIYDKPEVDYYISNGIKTQIDGLITKQQCDFKNKLFGHLSTIREELYEELSFFDFKIDKIIETKNLTKYLNEIKKIYNITVDVNFVGNKKGYVGDVKYSMLNININEITRGFKYPNFQYFYNEEIKEIVTLLYDEDFQLFKDLNYEHTFHHFEIPESVTPEFERAIFEFKSTSAKEFSSYCILIIPNSLNVYNFSKTIESINRRQLCDIYILVDQIYYNKYSHCFDDTSVHLINSGCEFYNCSNLDDSCVEKYLYMYKNHYENVILYNDMPIFVSDLSQKVFNKIGQIEKIDINHSMWYFKSELEKDIESFGYPDYYLLNYNGIVLKSNVFLEIFNTIKEIIHLKKGEYPILEVLIPTVLHHCAFQMRKGVKNNNYFKIYSVDETLWSIDHNKVNYEVLTNTYKY